MSDPKTINCEEALIHLLEYLDRELVGDLQQQMERHMASCRSCLSRLEFEQTLKAHIRRTGTDHAPDTLRDRISNLIKAYDRETGGES
jgi:anti-sigma factor (TIGR02949 family)